MSCSRTLRLAVSAVVGGDGGNGGGRGGIDAALVMAAATAVAPPLAAAAVTAVAAATAMAAKATAANRDGCGRLVPSTPPHSTHPPTSSISHLHVSQLRCATPMHSGTSAAMTSTPPALPRTFSPLPFSPHPPPSWSSPSPIVPLRHPTTRTITGLQASGCPLPRQRGRGGTAPRWGRPPAHTRQPPSAGGGKPPRGRCSTPCNVDEWGHEKHGGISWAIRYSSFLSKNHNLTTCWANQRLAPQ